MKSDTSKFNQSDTLYLYNAGLILLAPFLPQLFEGLGWIQDKRFTDKDKTQLAVQLLQYLCDGQDEPPEYQLSLNKILCGLHPQILYTPERLLLNIEKEQAEALLQAVVGHAAALGLKTPDALRGSFLLRKGTLESAGTHWLLRVETETWDILLPRIPWNYQIVKLPWMEVPIYVEWEVN